jgi:hypothetical protein
MAGMFTARCITTNGKWRMRYGQRNYFILYVLKSSLFRGQSQLKMYNILATPSLLYGCKVWTSKQRDVRGLKRQEVKFMRRTVKYSIQEHRRNE